jgi:transposase InsO family protein
VLSWDITYLRNATLRGSYFYLYMYVDVFSRRIAGSDVHEEQSAELAAGLLRRVCAEHEVHVADGCVLHADNGAPMKGSTMLATMQALGIVASFSRPSVSDDNPFIESLFRHLKYAPSYPSKGFVDIAQARQWVEAFVDWYNHHHLHSAIGLVTPDDRHCGRDIALLEHRRAVYRAAREKNPSRWTCAPRSWRRPDAVVLNPERTVALQRPCQHAA